MGYQISKQYFAYHIVGAVGEIALVDFFKRQDVGHRCMSIANVDFHTKIGSVCRPPRIAHLFVFIFVAVEACHDIG